MDDTIDHWLLLLCARVHAKGGGDKFEQSL